MDTLSVDQLGQGFRHGSAEEVFPGGQTNQDRTWLLWTSPIGMPSFHLQIIDPSDALRVQPTSFVH